MQRENESSATVGEAQAIEMVQNALAESLVKLNSANPNENVIQLKSLEAFAKGADGKATKIIIPSEIQGLAGLAAGLKGIMLKITKTKQNKKLSCILIRMQLLNYPYYVVGAVEIISTAFLHF